MNYKCKICGGFSCVSFGYRIELDCLNSGFYIKAFPNTYCNISFEKNLFTFRAISEYGFISYYTDQELYHIERQECKDIYNYLIHNINMDNYFDLLGDLLIFIKAHHINKDLK